MGSGGHRRLLAPTLCARSRRRRPRRLSPPALRDRGGVGASEGHGTGSGPHTKPDAPRTSRVIAAGSPRCSGRRRSSAPPQRLRRRMNTQNGNGARRARRGPG